MTFAEPPTHPDAPCRANPELWFAPKATQRREATIECQACPIRWECLQGARERREQYGVWGGVDFEDVTHHAPSRARAQADGRHPRTPPKCGTPSGASAHYKRGEKPCEPCRLAHNAKQAERYARGRQTA